MYISVWSWLRRKLEAADKKSVSTTDDLWNDPEFQDMLANYCFRELAFESAVNLIAHSVSKCEFKTFQGGREIRAQEYYLFNVEPNTNQNSSQFIQKWVHTLYHNNEALIIEQNGQLLVADSFQRKPYALLEDTFSGVTVENFTFNKTFHGSDVLYFQLNQVDVRRLTNGIYESYMKLIGYAMRSYQKSQSTRGTMSFDTIAQGDPKFEERVKDMLEKKLKPFFTSENAVLPLFAGWKYDEMPKRSYSNDSSRDIRAMIDDISDMTAKALCIPPALLRGEVAGLDSAMDMFLTFCVDPLCDMIQEEINRKRNGYAGFLAGNKIMIDTKCIKHVDLLSVSTSIDKLIASGAFCVNDIRMLVGDQPIDEPWAWEHWMTKNYAPSEELLNLMEGGAGNA